VKRLYVLRHAKSSWKDASLADHDRPLAGRGRRAAKAMARYVRDAGIAPELVLCSTALRARQTLERLEPALGKRSTRVEAELYGAGPRALLERVHAVPDPVEAVLVIGHNPGLQELVLDLARPAAARREVEIKFPTCGLAALECPATRWPDVRAGEAELVAFVRPRDLEVSG